MKKFIILCFCIVSVFCLSVNSYAKTSAHEITVYPTGDAAMDLSNVQSAIDTNEVVYLARSNLAGEPTEFNLIGDNGSGGVLYLSKNKPYVLTALDPSNPPILNVINEAFDGTNFEAEAIVLDATGADVTMKNLIINSNRTLNCYSYANLTISGLTYTVDYIGGKAIFFGDDAGKTLVEESFLFSNVFVDGGVSIVGSNGDFTLRNNWIEGVPPFEIHDLKGSVKATGNDLTATYYTHLYVLGVGIDIAGNDPDTSSIKLKKNRIHLNLPPPVKFDPGFSFLVNQVIYGVVLGNGVLNTGAYNVEIDDLSIDSNQPLNVAVGFAGNTSNCKVNNISYPPTVGYDFTSLAWSSWFAQEVFYVEMYEPIGLLPKNWQEMMELGEVQNVAFLLSGESWNNILIDTQEPYYTIFDYSEYTQTNPEYIDWLNEDDNLAVLAQYPGYSAQAVWQSTCGDYSYLPELYCYFICGGYGNESCLPLCMTNWSKGCELSRQPPSQFIDPNPDSYNGQNYLLGKLAK